MVQSAFVARCPYEIGDTIIVYHHGTGREELKVITDIVCVHSLKKGTVEFLYELDGRNPLVHLPDPKRRG